MDGPDFGVSMDWRDRTVVVSVSGDIDLVTAPQPYEALTRVLRECPDVVVVDSASGRGQRCRDAAVVAVDGLGPAVSVFVTLDHALAAA